jgi:hypothetical protein
MTSTVDVHQLASMQDGRGGGGGHYILNLGRMFTEGCLLLNTFGQTVVTQTE